MTATMISWHCFPSEIRLTILEVLLQDGCSLDDFATVSREWQTIIERHNFSRIKLTSSRVADFGSMVHRNRSLVRYIWLCLELQEYNCTECEPQGPESWGLSNAENALITTAFLDLFSTLSVWEPDSSLLLDISVYSPSDSEHWFKYLTFEPDVASDMCGRDQHAKQSMLVKATDHHHGWIAGSKYLLPPAVKNSKIAELLHPNGNSPQYVVMPVAIRRKCIGHNNICIRKGLNDNAIHPCTALRGSSRNKIRNIPPDQRRRVLAGRIAQALDRRPLVRREPAVIDIHGLQPQGLIDLHCRIITGKDLWRWRRINRYSRWLHGRGAGRILNGHRIIPARKTIERIGILEIYPVDRIPVRRHTIGHGDRKPAIRSPTGSGGRIDGQNHTRRAARRHSGGH